VQVQRSQEQASGVSSIIIEQLPGNRACLTHLGYFALSHMCHHLSRKLRSLLLRPLFCLFPLFLLLLSPDLRALCSIVHSCLSNFIVINGRGHHRMG